ncbi:MAG: ribulose-phosphate 3-epimerase [Anaerolineales bacterium]|nr:ribulose-phosphate 3-epimerase [Anaerolineales bacterium]
MNVKFAPSILSADFSRLGAQISEACEAGVEYIHVDVMDGHFVPNITIGPPVIKAIKPIVKKYHVPLDVHLMISNPDDLIDDFIIAGADILNVHVEVCTHLHRTIQRIKEAGIKSGVTLNPATPLNTLEEILPSVDLVLLMSVNPGFGGQSYIPSSTEKIKRLRQMLVENHLSHIELEVDGGIKADNIAEVVNAGVSIVVAGSAIFNQNATVTENIHTLRLACENAF